MARKSEYGRYILSAGEVGAFTVCPEAWKLKMVDKVTGAHSASSDEGRKLHAEWAARYSEAENLKRVALVVISLMALATVAFALVNY